MQRFRIAMIGCGSVSRMHLDAYSAHSNRIELVAACDPDPERAAAAARDYDIPDSFGSLAETIAEAEWDVGVVCTPTAVREPLLAQLAGAGKHAFVEKPFASSVRQATQMTSLFRDADLQLAVNQNFRYHYPFAFARDAVHDGLLGRITAVAHQDLVFRQDRGWRHDAERHALEVMGVHWLDGFRWMLGERALSISCKTASSRAIECRGETDASVQLCFESGTTVTYLQSFSSHLDRTDTLVIGDRASLHLTYDRAVLLDESDGPQRVWQNPYAGGNKPEATFQTLDRLLFAIESGDEAPTSGRDNIETIGLLEAAYRSAERGEPVPLTHEASATA